MTGRDDTRDDGPTTRWIIANEAVKFYAAPERPDEFADAIRESPSRTHLRRRVACPHQTGRKVTERVMLLTMFDGAAETVGSDCCEGVHGEWELADVSESKHGRNFLTWRCSGCTYTEHTETYRDQHEKLQYPDPDGVLIEFETPRRRHRR